MSDPKTAQHVARMARRLVASVTIYTDASDELAKQTLNSLGDENIKLENRHIERLEMGPGTEVTVYLTDGTKINEGFLVHKPKTRVNGPFAHQFELDLTDAGDIKTNGMFHESSMPGVFAVGDCASMLKAVTQAIAMGSFGAAGLASQLQVPVLELEAEM